MLPAAPERTDVRDSQGRFAPGNEGGKGRGWKQAIRRMLGRDGVELSGVAASVAEDAFRLFAAALKELPHDGPTVRALVARKARHEALEAYWSARAIAELGTPEGIAAEERATLHGHRAERLTITSIDVASRLAAAERSKPPASWPAPAVLEAEDDEPPRPTSGENAAPGPEPNGNTYYHAGGEFPREVAGQAEPPDAGVTAAPLSRAPQNRSSRLGSARPEDEFRRLTQEGRDRALGRVVASDLCRHGANTHQCPTCFNAAERPSPSDGLPANAMPKPRDPSEVGLTRAQLIERRRQGR